jgi:hypothetical protein
MPRWGADGGNGFVVHPSLVDINDVSDEVLLDLLAAYLKEIARLSLTAEQVRAEISDRRWSQRD